MRLTQWGELGVLLCIEIGRQGESGASSASDLAEELKIDVQYAQQILHRLKKGGVIESIRGPKGGYKLMGSAESITLRKMLEAAEGETFEVFCENKGIDEERCNPATSNCTLRPIWYQLRDHINQYLESITLLQLLSSPVEQILVQISGGRAQFTAGKALT
jgi:Rrf2 family iron-sulfur cluster assembly transcriptional regulator